ncbi:MMPL family transporter [Pelagicoccus sp. SDUM812003]|uniref:efflux RND transporter permease subunit n=1 Tax=Pelagicoccus sp. SDUM812003 TaxID=3041267 RepID=UPI00280E9C9A|nr:MMPL family transporter [Pelagicoccus sp. SDUM812003]MDQ8204423.1 MMPL family transporter [Pelagicoccus sp. SDUM812003]
MKNAFIEIALKHPKGAFGVSIAVATLLLALVAWPTVFPDRAMGLNPATVDTDPENMLSADEPARVTHNQLKATFGLKDMLVVGVTADQEENGVFNPRTLADVHALVEAAESLQWETDSGVSGVVRADIIAPSTVDAIEQAGLGSVSFRWLMPEPPQSDEEAIAVANAAARLPMYDGSMVSEDRKALALYFPLTEKSASYRVAEELKSVIAGFGGQDHYYIAGLPVAQDQFGKEMFVQMAISAPMAMALIFVLMWLFFRNLTLIVSPMIVAMLSVIVSMGLLVATGNTIHIMSSMIPIFIMPIAVLDAVHILSDFFDKYPIYKDRRRAIKETVGELWSPMLFTSITTSVGFASLALTPIPPVQVFGLFVAVGAFAAWVFTILLMPAYVMLLPEKALENFGSAEAASGEENGILSRLLRFTGRVSFAKAKLVAIVAAALVVFSGFGISRIVINDNPVKWFEPSHEIRIADTVMNDRLAGTYMAYLAFEAPALTKSGFAEPVLAAATGLQDSARSALEVRLAEIDYDSFDDGAFIDLQDWLYDQQDAAESDSAWEAWDRVAQTMEERWSASAYFKQPEALQAIEALEANILSNPHVGKVVGLPEVTKTLHRELFEGDEERYRIPDTSNAVAQSLMTYESSHRPQDLWHFVTPDYRQAVLWIQLNSGDNVDMSGLVDQVKAYLAENPLPGEVSTDWFGLTYINVIWQEQMVAGMMNAFLGSFVTVLILMIILFRSFWWGLLSMVPLALTILVMYGIIGWIGKDYDMPVAVLSSLSLGLAVDYAIHFIARSREAYRQTGDWKEAMDIAFGDPARAIARNIIVIGLGFSPLLLAPLVPYQTVGVLISSILILAGLTTLVLLPALIHLLPLDRKGSPSKREEPVKVAS